MEGSRDARPVELHRPARRADDKGSTDKFLVVPPSVSLPKGAAPRVASARSSRPIPSPEPAPGRYRWRSSQGVSASALNWRSATTLARARARSAWVGASHCQAYHARPTRACRGILMPKSPMYLCFLAQRTSWRLREGPWWLVLKVGYGTTPASRRGRTSSGMEPIHQWTWPLPQGTTATPQNLSARKVRRTTASL